MAYGIWIVQESSWFYKEILTWHDDALTYQLLNNFSWRESFLRESMGRNNYRFPPSPTRTCIFSAGSRLTPRSGVW